MRNDSAGGFQPRLFSRSFQKGQINLISPKGTSFGRSGGGEIWTLDTAIKRYSGLANQSPNFLCPYSPTVNSKSGVFLNLWCQIDVNQPQVKPQPHILPGPPGPSVLVVDMKFVFFCRIIILLKSKKSRNFCFFRFFPEYSKHFRTAYRTHALQCSSSALHLNFFCVLYLHLLPTLHTSAFHFINGSVIQPQNHTEFHWN